MSWLDGTTGSPSPRHQENTWKILRKSLQSGGSSGMGSGERVFACPGPPWYCLLQWKYLAVMNWNQRLGSSLHLADKQFLGHEQTTEVCKPGFLGMTSAVVPGPVLRRGTCAWSLIPVATLLKFVRISSLNFCFVSFVSDVQWSVPWGQGTLAYARSHLLLPPHPPSFLGWFLSCLLLPPAQ